jgi:hypothetical protein
MVADLDRVGIARAGCVSCHWVRSITISAPLINCNLMISTYLQYATAAFVVLALLIWTASSFFYKNAAWYLFGWGCIAVAGIVQPLLFLYG